MTEHEEREFETKAEKDLAGYRIFPNGRDYRSFKQRYITRKDRDNFRANFDLVFPNAPGAGL